MDRLMSTKVLLPLVIYLCRLIPDMAYNVFGGTLNLTQLS